MTTRGAGSPSLQPSWSPDPNRSRNTPPPWPRRPSSVQQSMELSAPSPANHATIENGRRGRTSRRGGGAAGPAFSPLDGRSAAEELASEDKALLIRVLLLHGPPPCIFLLLSDLPASCMSCILHACSSNCAPPSPCRRCWSSA